jgi:hypothetical protein
MGSLVRPWYRCSKAKSCLSSHEGCSWCPPLSPKPSDLSPNLSLSLSLSVSLLSHLTILYITELYFLPHCSGAWSFWSNIHPKLPIPLRPPAGPFPDSTPHSTPALISTGMVKTWPLDPAPCGTLVCLVSGHFCLWLVFLFLPLPFRPSPHTMSLAPGYVD